MTRHFSAGHPEVLGEDAGRLSDHFPLVEAGVLRADDELRRGTLEMCTRERNDPVAHPDAGGSTEAMQRLNEARLEIEGAGGVNDQSNGEHTE
jgi:hypothetical protein